MKSTALLLALMLAASPLMAADRVGAGKPAVQATVPPQRLLPAESSIRFVSRQMGVPVEGHFRRFSVLSQFDPKRPDTSNVTLEIDLLSVDIGNADTETELTKPGWFDSKRRAAASFRSNAVRALGGARFEIQGVLAIKGIEQRITVPVVLTQKGTTSIAKGSLQIKRMDFRIGDGEWNDVSIVANDVAVHFQLALVGVPPL